MGQAKQRGTYEERKAMAINRDIEIRRSRAQIHCLGSGSEISRKAVRLLALTASFGGVVMIKRGEE